MLRTSTIVVSLGLLILVPLSAAPEGLSGAGRGGVRAGAGPPAGTAPRAVERCFPVADQAICIGPAKSARSYLDIPSIISAAEITDVDAIHPGYGFLSENAGFAEVCEVSGLKFIGPRPDVIRLMGVKERARAFMRECGVPILPGSPGVLKPPKRRSNWPARSVSGHPEGVRRRRRTRHARREQRRANWPGCSTQAQQEAGAAFGCADVYLEKYVGAPRHIEFQVLADERGTWKSWVSANAASSAGIKSSRKNRLRRS